MAEATLRRFLLFAATWVVLTQGDLYAWPFGLLTVGLATAASLALFPRPGWRVRWLALPGFLGFFLAEMLLGGVDVARRAFHPRKPTAPAFVEYRWTLELEAARLFMTWAVSLLPGTVSAELNRDSLLVHVLDTGTSAQETLERLEVLIARLLVSRRP